MTLTIADVAEALNATAVGETTLEVARPRQPSEAGPDDLALAMDPKFAGELAGCPAQAAVLWADADWQGLGLKAAVLVGRHRYAMSGVTQLFDIPYSPVEGVHPSAIVDQTAEIAEGVDIGPFTLVGPRVKIASGTRLLGHVTVYEDAEIGPDTLVHAGVRISARVKIGARVIIQPNAVIGSDGFSFVTPEPSAVETARKAGGSIQDATEAPEWTRINSLGSVIVSDDVEIGAGSAIDRGTVSDTRVGRGSKIDNLVHIAHNVQIGETCLICGLVGIAGSTKVGNRVVLGGTVGVADHVEIGDDVIAGGAAGITSSVPSGSFVMGYPARERREYLRELKAVRRLPKTVERLSALEKRVSNDESNS
ncbi:MAG: UDP-3-O-(3-hydroxymyristoyl)glucosamine N-acyltransferase [Pseudomonadota bacterium]